MANRNQPEEKVVTLAFEYVTKTVHHKPYDKISPFRPELSAKGKNVVVTGGGSGIGKAIGIAFVQAGARSVSILGRREDRLKGTLAEMTSAATGVATICHYEQADLTKREQVDRAFASIAAKVGKLDILVSNAGGLQPVAPILGYDVDTFMYGFDINVRTAFNAIQAFIPLAIPEPMIIDISSAIAHIQPMQGLSHHGASHAAAVKMMTYFAAENPAIHFVSIQPGAVATELAQRVGAGGQDSRKSCMRTNIEGQAWLILSNSGTTWSFLCLDCISRRRVPQEQVCVGELGRGRTDGSSGRDSEVEAVYHGP